LEQAGDQFVEFLSNFLKIYPDYGKQYRSLIFTGESYAGKYIPYFAARIQDQGLFNLETLMIGNPYTSPVNQRTSTYKVGESLNIIDEYNMP
jgi:carboxypeptidase D